MAALSSLVAPTHTLLPGTVGVWTIIWATRGVGEGGREGKKEREAKREREGGREVGEEERDRRVLPDC